MGRKFKDGFFAGLTDTDLEVFRVYVECDGSAEAAARKSYTASTTVKYHLNKIQDVTGLNPHCTFDRIRLMARMGCFNGLFTGLVIEAADAP